MGSLLEPLNQVIRASTEMFYSWTGSYTWAIILVTALVRIVISPLFVIQMVSMKKMQNLQPRVKELQTKYKGDSEKLNKEMMELYRTHKVNPISGCLPMVIQLPILLSIYNVIQSFEYQGVPLLFGIAKIQLNAADPTYVLAFLSAVFTFLQTWLGSNGTDQTQKSMMYVFPIMIFWFSTQVSAGVTLYWVISTVLTIIQQGIYPGFQRSLLPKGETAAR